MQQRWFFVCCVVRWVNCLVQGLLSLPEHNAAARGFQVFVLWGSDEVSVGSAGGRHFPGRI